MGLAFIKRGLEVLMKNRRFFSPGNPRIKLVMGDFPAMEGRPTDRVSAFKPGYVTAPDALAYPMFLTGL